MSGPMRPARPAATNAPTGPLACSDAERRAARRHANALRAAGRTVRVEALWVRTARAPALAACAAAGVAASVLSVDRPVAALAVAGVALALALAELGPLPLLRRLAYARATQNVLSAGAAPAVAKPVTLVLVAAVDRPRASLLHRARIPAGPITVAALALVAVCAAARVAFDAGGTLLGAVQLVPTAVLVLAVGCLVDAAVAPPAIADEGAVEAVVAAAKRLDAAPTRRLAVETVLAGAWPLGLHARLMRDRRGPEEVVLAIVEPGPEARYATRHPTLRAIAERTRGAQRRGRAPRAGRRPVIAVAGPPDRTTDLVVDLAAGIDAELGAQPTSSERSANSTK
jgi:hypothetical protein